jgi:hypothetical protein
MTGVRKKITIEATGGHHELGALLDAVHKAVEKLRTEATSESVGSGFASLPIYAHASINLEGTIRVETEDDL